MTWDYFISLAAEMQEDATLLDNLQKSASKSEKNKKDFKGRLNKLTERMTQNLGGDPGRILSADLLDQSTIWWFRDWVSREDVRWKSYIKTAQGISISEPGKVSGDVDFRPNFEALPSFSWLGLCVDFELLTPWHSKDDRIFHVLDNPVRKDRVFGVPFMAAASWKGMLRWACRMQAGLREHFESGKKFEEWKDPDWILHLFGNEKGEEGVFHQGALVFYPTWFDKIGFEVINPHSRARRAGTQPIYYEVVPPGSKGTLYLLYAPGPGMKPAADPTGFLPKLLDAIEALLTTYGISAKRTVGWGTAEIREWKAFRKGRESVSFTNKENLWQEIRGWFQGGTL